LNPHRTEQIEKVKILVNKKQKATTSHDKELGQQLSKETFLST
jgi:hypothetical protein